MDNQSLEICCPQCREQAVFEEPFFFCTAPHPTVEAQHQHQWGGWIVIERFPTQFQWHPPTGSGQYLRGGGPSTGGYPLMTYGLLRCHHCYHQAKYHLSWPQDAYWQWTIRGKTLWAWDRAHALQIYNFIKSPLRPSTARATPGLRHIPSHFLSAKVRDEVIKKMDRDLQRIV